MRSNSLLISLALVISGTLAAAEMPVTGTGIPELAGFDQFMQGHMSKWQIPGGALAVSRNGQLLYARGYGFADRELAEPVRPDALFRIASLSKPVTAVATMKLVEEGRLDLDARAFDLLSDYLPDPRPETFDPRILSITIRQLLHHTAGWDMVASGFDPMSHVVEAAHLAGEKPPAGCPTVVRGMIRLFPLEFAPGSRSAYSNLGYCILGLLIEKVSGTSYERYVREHVLRPAGIERMMTGRTRLEHRVPGEVRYYDVSGNARSVFPDGPALVPAPYGGFYLEAMAANGGWIASAVDLVKFADSVDGRRGAPLLNARTVAEMLSRPPAPVSQSGNAWYAKGWGVFAGGNGGLNWTHNGGLPGTATLLVRFQSGLTWAAVFNSRPAAEAQFFTELDRGLLQAAQSVRTWPAHDLHPEFAPAGTRPVLAPTMAVTSAASGEAGIVSGSWVSIRGAGLAASSRTWRSDDFSGDRLPVELDGVRVLMNGQPAAVYAISETHVTAQAPELPAGRMWVQISRGGETSEPVAALVRNSAPELYAQSCGERLCASATHPDGVPAGDPGVISGSRPAVPGGRVLLFATGLAPSPAGRLIRAPAALNDPVSVRFGGADATVEFAGLVAPGLFQINVVVPESLAAGDHEVTIHTQGQASRSGVILSVRR